MPLGPGKYDAAATAAREATAARGVILIIIDGNKGSGFSVQAEFGVHAKLPQLLRHLADEIEGNPV